jgi:hypothetical protein
MQTTTQYNCPLCDLPAEFHEWASDLSFTINVICRRCGRFRISEEAREDLARDAKNKYLLTAACRALQQSKEVPLILTTNIAALVKNVPRLTVSEQLDKLLDLLAQNTSEPGALSTFDPSTDYPLLVVQSSDAAAYLIDALSARNYVTRHNPTQAQLTIDGWERAQEIRRSGRESRAAFVAMWFDETRNRIYHEAIEPAFREAGFRAVRIDKTEHLNRIDDEIISQLRQSRFVVADFTGQRHGVYFEAGFMLGLSRNVYWLCDKSELEKIHFDNRQYNFIDYDSPEDAKRRLYNRIMANEGKGPGEFGP